MRENVLFCCKIIAKYILGIHIWTVQETSNRNERKNSAADAV